MIIHRREHRVLVQGLTGKQGTFWAEKMIACGTRVVGGVNPKRAGESHIGLPVFASAKAAMESDSIRYGGHVHSARHGQGRSARRNRRRCKVPGDLDRAYPGPRRHGDPCRGEDPQHAHHWAQYSGHRHARRRVRGHHARSQHECVPARPRWCHLTQRQPRHARLSQSHPCRALANRPSSVSAAIR